MTPVRISLAVFLLAAALKAFPCSIAILPHELDPAETAIDESLPQAPLVSLVEVKRGRAPQAAPGGMMPASSCDDIGMITLRVAGASDDRTAAEALGYIAIVTSGEPPEGLQPREAVRAPEGELVLHWLDGATDDQEPLDFELAVITVDLAGNRSAQSRPVRIRPRAAKR